MKTLIRHATGADFATLLSIDGDSFPREVAYDCAELSYLMKRPGAETLVLEEDGGIAAFLLFEVNRRRKLATIITLDVREEKRRKGYASSLLKQSEDLLATHGVEKVDLQVDVENEGAIAFYRKHGFQTVRLLRNYYPTGHDAWLMVKTLRTDGGA